MVRAKLLSLLKNFSYPETVFFPFLLLAHYSKKYEQIKLKKKLSLLMAAILIFSSIIIRLPTTSSLLVVGVRARTTNDR